MPTVAGFRPVIVGSGIGDNAMARAFHERYGLRTTMVAIAETGASLVNQSIPVTNLVDDQGGNTTKLADESFVYDGSGRADTITARILALPGGVTATIPVTGTWSYPNIHRDIIATANSSALVSLGVLHR
jgi:hypothetical protein